MLRAATAATAAGTEADESVSRGAKDRRRPADAASPRECMDPAVWAAIDAEAEAWLAPLRATGEATPASAGPRSAASAPPAPEADDSAFLLVHRADRFELRPPGEHHRPGIHATFPPDAPERREGGRTAPRSPLLRAIGPRARRVIDATAGLGGDACRLALAGLPVLACERDPVVFALLASGWRASRRAGAVPDAAAARVELRWTEADGVLETLEEDDVAVYVDPMYPPPRRASAKPRRELQVLRALLGHGVGAGLVEAAALVERVRTRAARVVVKRPHHAAPLVADPSFEIESKLVRFDVYVNPARMSPLVAEASA